MLWILDRDALAACLLGILSLIAVYVISKARSSRKRTTAMTIASKGAAIYEEPPVLLSIYGDESSDERQEKVWTVVGVIGTSNEWGLLEEAWRTRTGGLEFHACDESEFSPHSKTPDPEKHQERLDLYRDLVKIVVDSYVAGLCVSLDVVAYEETFGTGIQDIGYYSSLTAIIDNAATLAQRFNAQGPESVEIEFVFDQRVGSEENVLKAYSAFRAQPQWRDSTFFKPLSFTTSYAIRIQVADLLAREARKDMERVLGYEKRPQRKAFTALDACKKFIWIRRGRDFCEDLRNAMGRLSDETGFKWDAYQDWLRENQLSDDFGSRAAFLAYLDQTRNR